MNNKDLFVEKIVNAVIEKLEPKFINIYKKFSDIDKKFVDIDKKIDKKFDDFDKNLISLQSDISNIKEYFENEYKIKEINAKKNII